MFEVIEGGRRSAAWDRDRMDDLDQILHPAKCFAHPIDVVQDSSLSLAEKRAILSSWASDACAVEAMPPLRQLPGAPTPGTFDEIMDALQLLDRGWTSRALGRSTATPVDQAGGGGVYFG